MILDWTIFSEIVIATEAALIFFVRCARDFEIINLRFEFLRGPEYYSECKRKMILWGVSIHCFTSTQQSNRAWWWHICKCLVDKGLMCPSLQLRVTSQYFRMTLLQYSDSFYISRCRCRFRKLNYPIENYYVTSSIRTQTL